MPRPSLITDWSKRLQELYDEARKRDYSRAVQLYSEVTTLMDYLEGIGDEMPQGFDLQAACDSLAYRLRQI